MIRLYHVAEMGVAVVHSWPSTEPISAFIDGDAGDCEPCNSLFDPSVQLIVASFPKRATQKWTNQTGHGSIISQRAVKLWSRKELLLTGLFLQRSNLSVRLLEDSASYFGYNPRECFRAAFSVRSMESTKGEVMAAISEAVCHGIDKIAILIGNARSGNGNSNISMKRFEDSKRGNTVSLYYSIFGIPEAPTFLGGLYEMQVLKFLDHISRSMMPHQILHQRGRFLLAPVQKI